MELWNVAIFYCSEMTLSDDFGGFEFSCQILNIYLKMLEKFITF
jgi:hypothetical protein